MVKQSAHFIPSLLRATTLNKRTHSSKLPSFLHLSHQHVFRTMKMIPLMILNQPTLPWNFIKKKPTLPNCKTAEHISGPTYFIFLYQTLHLHSVASNFLRTSHLKHPPLVAQNPCDYYSKSDIS